MRNSAQARRFLLGTLLAASALGSGAQAQNDAAGRPPRPGDQAEVVINCCKCVGQESGAVSISTGTAPWRVSNAATPVWQPIGQWLTNTGMVGPTNPNPQVVPGNMGTNPLPNVWTDTLKPAAWLQPNPGAAMGSYANGHYTYKLQIRVPNCVIKQQVMITGRIAADDLAKVFVDGYGGGQVTLTPSVQYPWAGFGTAAVKSFSYALGGGITKPGIYTVRVEVDNLGGGPTGIVVNGTANGKCSEKTEKGKDDRDDRD